MNMSKSLARLLFDTLWKTWSRKHMRKVSLNKLKHECFTFIAKTYNTAHHSENIIPTVKHNDSGVTLTVTFITWLFS